MTDRDALREVAEALKAASRALRSYQYGNSARDLAEDVANHADAALALPAVAAALGGNRCATCGLALNAAGHLLHLMEDRPAALTPSGRDMEDDDV